MSRELRRVPSGFDWPLDKTWEGYFPPKFLESIPCANCDGMGWSQQAEHLSDLWYGKVDFDPRSQGSEPLTAESPSMRRTAERNVGNAPEFYGTGEAAIVREATRLANLHNRYWSNHLSQEDVDALVASEYGLNHFTSKFVKGVGWVRHDPMPEILAADVNEHTAGNFFDHPDLYTLQKIYAKRGGWSLTCESCGGRGSHEAFKGQRKAAKKWKPIKPPKGPAYQVWETVSEGSPVTPAFDTPEELAAYLVNKSGGTIEGTMKWILGSGWAPTGVSVGGEFSTADEIVTGQSTVDFSSKA